MLTIAPPAVFGKLPALGDFVSRGVDLATSQTIDEWLAAWMRASISALGDEFDDRYCSAQPWLFDGERCRALLIPSTDMVGRKFPFFAIVSPSLPLQKIYDSAVLAIVELWGPDQFLDRLNSETVYPDSDSDAAGWFLPDETESALPHPMEVNEADAVREIFA